jgi:NTP pyrophosphatase (non-canonical NTP hydrolase)
MNEKEFQKKVVSQIKRIRKNKLVSNSVHEGYALLQEELDEFWEEVKKKTRNRDKKNMILELAQIAALTQIIAEDNL